MADLTRAEAEQLGRRFASALEATIAAVRTLALTFEDWHRRTFEPIAKRYLQRRLVAVLRAELRRREPGHGPTKT